MLSHLTQPYNFYSITSHEYKNDINKLKHILCMTHVHVRTHEFVNGRCVSTVYNVWDGRI